MPKQNSTTQMSPHAEVQGMHGNLGYSDEQWIEATLDGIVRDAYLEIGAAPNSPIHKAMLKLSRQVWNYAEMTLQKK